MAPGNEQKGLVSNPFLNPICFWQNYLINWIEAGRGYYENPIKAIEYSFKVWWDPWLRAVGAAQGEKRYPMKKTDMLKVMQLVLKIVTKRLHNSTILLNSDYPYDAFILYSFAYEEFGKALIIKDYIDNNIDGLSVWLFRAHDRKMAIAKQCLPDGCSQFTPMVTLLHPTDKTETVKYKVWHRKDVQTGTILRSPMTTGGFADVTHVSSNFDEITRMEHLYVNYDPRTDEWHTNPDNSIDELKRAITLLDESLIGFAAENNVSLE
jgi:hypothetical protein